MHGIRNRVQQSSKRPLFASKRSQETEATIDYRTTQDAPTKAERTAVEDVLGPPESLWTGADERSPADDHVSYGGFHASQERRHLLLPVLHAVQDNIGWVSHGALNYIAQRVPVSPAEAFGVATFYDLIATESAPARVAYVCDDIACKASGVDSLLQDLTERLGESGTDTNGGSWKRSPCLGQCEKGSASFIQIAGEQNISLSPVSAEEIVNVLSGAAAKTNVTPTASSPGTALLSHASSSLEEFQAAGGYDGLVRAFSIGPAEVRTEIDNSGLRGRGGAAFPAGIKWNAVAAEDGQKYVICNADESEPGTFKDRVLMEANPFGLIEALTIAGFAVGATIGYIYIRGEYPVAHSALNAALSQAKDAGFLGDDILGNGVAFEIELRRGAGAYICGEETALFNSIEGFRGEPRQKPPFPTQSGLFGRPTLINNVESLMNVPSIVLDGGDTFASIGTADSKGPKLFCLSGNVVNPGVYEVPFGATARDLIALAGGTDGDIAAVLIGGAAGSFVSEEDLNIPLTFEDTRSRDIGLGSGVVLVFNTKTDMADIVSRIAEFFAHESCGLCVPCRVGTVRQNETLLTIRSGNGDNRESLELLNDLDEVLKEASICGLGQAASLAVQSALTLGLIGAER